MKESPNEPIMWLLPHFLTRVFIITQLVIQELTDSHQITVPATLTALSHDQIVPTLIFNGKVDLRYNDQDSALGRRGDGPGALDVCRVVAGVVGRFNKACVFSELSSTVPV